MSSSKYFGFDDDDDVSLVTTLEKPVIKLTKKDREEKPKSKSAPSERHNISEIQGLLLKGLEDSFDSTANSTLHEDVTDSTTIFTESDSEYSTFDDASTFDDDKENDFNELLNNRPKPRRSARHEISLDARKTEESFQTYKGTARTGRVLRAIENTSAIYKENNTTAEIDAKPKLKKKKKTNKKNQENEEEFNKMAEILNAQFKEIEEYELLVE